MSRRADAWGGNIPQGLNRSRKKSLLMGKIAKSIPRRLKPAMILLVRWHE